MEVFGNSCFFGGREFLLGYSGPTAVGRRWEDSLVKNFLVKTILFVGKGESFLSFVCALYFLCIMESGPFSCAKFPPPKSGQKLIVLSLFLFHTLL